MSAFGKYDLACDLARKVTKAETVLLIVLDGNEGSGFSVMTKDQSVIAKIPALLRRVADDIEVSEPPTINMVAVDENEVPQ